MRISGNVSAWCRRAGHLALMALLASTAWADSMPSRVVEASTTVKSHERVVLLGDTATPGARFELAALTPAHAQLPSVGQQKSLPIGMGRALPRQPIELAALSWTSSNTGTQFTTVEWQSPGAAAVRLHLTEAKLPSGIHLYVYGTAHPERIYGPYSASNLRRAAGEWLPVVDGDTVRLEIQADPGVGAPQGSLSMATLAHLTRSIRGDLEKSLTELGQSGSCNIDIACPPSDAQWLQYGQSVAKYYFTEGNGDTFICTGTLINSASPEPLPDYFLTAAHCISTPTAAASMQFFWFFQRAICGGPAPTSVIETLDGATFLKTVAANDETLVRLNAPPPAGATRAGWTSTPVRPGDTLMTLHHPAGDLKKFSRGTDQGFTNYSSTASNSTGTHIRMQWNAGTTEGGSSGAGLFNEAGQLVGTLHGGAASCGIDQTAPDWFGRFDQAYPALRTYLMPSNGTTATPPPSAPTPVALSSGAAISSAVTASNSTFFSIATQANSTGLTVSLSALAGDADLYVYRDTTSGTSPTCASTTPAQAAETCVIGAPGAATWIIEVKGNDSTSFQITATVDNPAPPITQTSSSSGHHGGGGSMTTGLLGLLAFLTLVRTWPAERWRALLRFVPIAALAVSFGCTGTPTAAADRSSNIVLAPPTATELARKPATKDAPLAVGIGREVPLAERNIVLAGLLWTRTPAGVTAKLSVRSSGARALRVAMRLARDYPGLQIVFRDHGSLPASELLGPEPRWSPVISGDTAVMELTAPSLPPSDLVLEVPRVSHLP